MEKKAFKDNVTIITGASSGIGMELAYLLASEGAWLSLAARRQGKLEEAADSLSGVSTASTRDGNKLFFLSLIEGSADRAAQLMEAALNTSVAAVYRQEIYYRLAINDDFALTADVQYVKDDARSGANPGGFILGLRGTFEF